MFGVYAWGSLSNVELEAHIQAMAAVRAERMLDRAQAAAYPTYLQHSPDYAKRWWQRLLDDANAAFRDIASPSKRRGAGFTFNGIRVGVAELRAKLASALGGGLSG